jgi:hypothetical protein
MNDLQLVLDSVAVVLAAVLAAIGLAAAVRYRDWRFASIGIALVGLGLVGVVGAVNTLWPGAIPGGDVGTTPILLVIMSEALLYISLVTSRSWAPRSPNP